MSLALTPPAPARSTRLTVLVNGGAAAQIAGQAAAALLSVSAGRVRKIILEPSS
jgi:hypothetical protein